eukprot:908398-Pelagomonas_calceolata.AAC.7
MLQQALGDLFPKAALASRACTKITVPKSHDLEVRDHAQCVDDTFRAYHPHVQRADGTHSITIPKSQDIEVRDHAQCVDDTHRAHHPHVQFADGTHQVTVPKKHNIEVREHVKRVDGSQGMVQAAP